MLLNMPKLYSFRKNIIFFFYKSDVKAKIV